MSQIQRDVLNMQQLLSPSCKYAFYDYKHIGSIPKLHTSLIYCLNCHKWTTKQMAILGSCSYHGGQQIQQIINGQYQETQPIINKQQTPPIVKSNYQEHQHNINMKNEQSSEEIGIRGVHGMMKSCSNKNIQIQDSKQYPTITQTQRPLLYQPQPRNAFPQQPFIYYNSLPKTNYQYVYQYPFNKTIVSSVQKPNSPIINRTNSPILNQTQFPAQKDQQKSQKYFQIIRFTRNKKNFKIFQQNKNNKSLKIQFKQGGQQIQQK